MELKEKTITSNDIIRYKRKEREIQMPIETKHNRQITQVEIPVKETCLTRKKKTNFIYCRPSCCHWNHHFDSSINQALLPSASSA